MWKKIGNKQNSIRMGLIFAFVLGYGFGFAQDLNVRTYVDRTVVGLNEQFTLSIELTGKAANSVPDPEIPDLSAFASFLGKGTSQSIQFVNGKMSVSRVILCYYVATNTGKFQIPPISIAYGGKTYTSDPIEIEIQAGGASPQSRPQRPSESAQTTEPGEGEIFLRAVVDKTQVYPNEPVVVTYKLYTRLNVTSIGFSKLPSTGGFWVEDFELPAQPQVTQEVVNGKKYSVVTIKKMALFPMTPGTKTIEPMRLDCEVQVRTRSRDPFADFFDDSFFFGRTARKQVQSKPVTIEVLPFPEQGKPSDFSGLSGNFRISAKAQPQSVKTNEAITYKITIEGEGNIRSIKPPQIVFPSDFEVYPPKTTENVSRTGSKFSGQIAFEYVLIPRAPGQETLGPVRFSYFDPSVRQYRVIQTSPIVIQVSPGSMAYPSVVPSGLSKEEIRVLAQDIRFIKTTIPEFHPIGKKTRDWFGVAMGLPLLALGGAILIRRRQDRLTKDVAYARKVRAFSLAKKRLSSAKRLFHRHESAAFFSALAKTLQGYVADHFNVSEAGLLSDEVRSLLKSKNVSDALIQEYFDCASICDLKRFSPESATVEEMKMLYSRVEKLLGQLEKVLR